MLFKSAVLLIALLLVVASADPIYINAGDPPVQSSIKNGQVLSIVVDYNTNNSFMFFTIATNDSCGASSINVTAPDGQHQLTWDNGVTYHSRTPGLYYITVYGSFAQCAITISAGLGLISLVDAASRDSVFPIFMLGGTPINVTLNTLPTILILNTTAIPGVVDPFVLSILDGPSQPLASMVQSISDNSTTVSLNYVGSVGEVIPFVAGPNNNGFWQAPVFIWLTPGSTQWTIEVMDVVIQPLVRNGPPTMLFSGGYQVPRLTVLLPALTAPVNLTLSLASGSCSSSSISSASTPVSNLNDVVTSNFGSPNGLTPDSPTAVLLLNTLNQAMLYFVELQGTCFNCNCSFLIQLGVDQTAATLILASSTTSLSTTTASASTTSVVSVSDASTSTASVSATASTSAFTFTTESSTLTTGTSFSTTTTALDTSTSNPAVTSTVSITSAHATSSPAGTTAPPTTPVHITIALFAWCVAGAFLSGAAISGLIVYLVWGRHHTHEYEPVSS